MKSQPLRVALLYACGQSDERPFRPHVTLARLRGNGAAIARRHPIDRELSFTQQVEFSRTVPVAASRRKRLPDSRFLATGGQFPPHIKRVISSSLKKRSNASRTGLSQAFGTAAGTQDFDLVEQADVILVIGCNSIDAQSGIAAEYVMLATSLPENAYPASEILALYRLRWQIELAFKRLKTLLRIDCLPAKTDKGGRSWIYAHLILAIATDACSQDFLDSSP